MLQTDNYNVFAEIARPVLLKYLNENNLNAEQKKYLQLFKDWNLRNDVNEKGATVFRVWWDSLEVQTWGDEFANTKMQLPWPDESTLIESLIKDSAYQFADDISTPSKKETIADERLQQLAAARSEAALAVLKEAKAPVERIKLGAPEKLASSEHEVALKLGLDKAAR